jgi:hypothetical protein
MDVALQIFQFIMANWQMMLAAFVAVIVALIALCSVLSAIFLLVPGEQPEKFFQQAGGILQKIADFLAPYSKK